MTVLEAEHMFVGGWRAGIRLPVGWISREPAGSEATTRVTGTGDLQLVAGYDFANVWGFDLYQPRLLVRLEAGLPTGTVGELSSGSTPERVSVGRASYSGGVSATLIQFVHPVVGILIPLRYRQPLGRGESGLLFGPSIDYGAGIFWSATDWFTVSTRLTGSWLGQSENAEGTTLSNSGGHWLGTELSTSFSVGDSLGLSLAGHVPIYHNVNGQQLSQTFSVTGSLVIFWDHKAEEEEEGHDHGKDEEDGHDHGGHDH